MNKYFKYGKLSLGIISVIIAILFLIYVFSPISGLSFITSKAFLGFLILVNSIVMFYDSLKLYRVKYKAIAIATSGLLFILGIIPILIAYNSLNFSNYIATLTVSTAFMAIILFFAGAYFVLNHF